MLIPPTTTYRCQMCGHRQVFCGGLAYLFSTRRCQDCRSPDLEIIEVTPMG